MALVSMDAKGAWNLRNIWACVSPFDFEDLLVNSTCWLKFPTEALWKGSSSWNLLILFQSLREGFCPNWIFLTESYFLVNFPNYTIKPRTTAFGWLAWIKNGKLAQKYEFLKTLLWGLCKGAYVLVTK